MCRRLARLLLLLICVKSRIHILICEMTVSHGRTAKPSASRLLSCSVYALGTDGRAISYFFTMGSHSPGPSPTTTQRGGLPDGTGSTAIRSDIFFSSREKSLPCPVRGSPLTKLYFKTVSGRVSERLSTGVAGFLHGLAASWLGGIVLCWRATVSDCVNQPWLCLSRQWPVKTS